MLGELSAAHLQVITTASEGAVLEWDRPLVFLLLTP